MMGNYHNWAIQKRFVSGLLFILVFVVVLTGCSGGNNVPAGSSAAPSDASSGNTDAGAAPSGTLVVANEDDLNSLDPAAGYGTHTIRTLSNVYESLIKQDDSGNIIPGLATSWEPSADGMEYTFKLRENVKFQDGTPFNAEAVKISFDRALDPNNEYHYGPYGFPNFFEPNIKEITVVDEATVKFTLTQVDPTFLPNLLWSTFGIVSPEALKTYGKDFAMHGAGTGPFQIIEWNKGTSVVTKAYEGYWDGSPKIERLIFKPVQEDAARLTQLQTGEIQVAAGISPQLLEAIQGINSLKVLSGPGLHNWFMVFNTYEGPLKDVKVRQALNYAINREDMVKNLLQDTVTISNSFAYPDTWSYNPDSLIYSYDQEKAKQLLAEAGYPDGLTLKYIVPASGSGMIAPTQIANVIQSDLAKIGVKVEITTQDWNTYLSTIQAGLSQPSGTYDMAQFSWMGTSDDPGSYVNFFLQGNSTPEKPNGFNDGYYSNPKVTELLTKAMETIDQSARAELYKEAQVLVAQDAPWLFMFHAKSILAMSAKVEGLTPNPNMNYLSFAKAELK
ncbi:MULTISPECIES: ABC transporter substrate-binding protein [unclassified Paenibacillus]|uniref:ABC transporter substrate-binding protein n=1 Tax=unclassified Paenibacillus TaxID=185978 RepID=UPI00240643C6|nr:MULTISPECIES: ABC transporter substrate-binding protein [unclassified Paenibacillus]MDF9839396.1 peptide/nickel transport system substrate-binding protein [Paenibacillus sp. PastF-2]MDF9845976.1 peptide/nickel transport system substrate-binding protein [Paenibacillus sp. PastM-2]MDF9852549.1 peptide/nickel transport system substrate-binding protein [Paenibacillus sp. PastF-1]MDH6477721.1 peptide/nickel transport system substrate-binding protein [Paenibacillus sp. PastH-2]MDH6505460.1 peptid